MISGGTRTHAGEEVVQDGPDGGLQAQRGPDGGKAADQRDSGDEVDIEPVDVFVPIGPGYGQVGDVRLGAGLGLGPEASGVGRSHWTGSGSGGGRGEEERGGGGRFEDATI
jgi:hypothetical protein